MRSRFSPRTIRGKAVAASGLAITIFGLGIGLGAYVFVTQAAVNSATAVLEAQVGEIVDQLLEQASTDPASVDLEGLQTPVLTLAQVVDSNGTILVASPQLASTDRLCSQMFPPTRTTDRASLVLLKGQESFLRTSEQVKTPLGVLSICAVTSDHPIQKAQELVVLALLIALPSLVLGGSLVVWIAVGRALRAVHHMSAQAEAMQSTSDGELSVPQTQDEIEHLARTFNALLHRLHQQTKATRRFIADAGHELRNPLSTLRVTLEFADASDPASLRSGVREAVRDLDRLETLVEDLLALARVDSLDLPLEFAQLDLTSLVHECAESAKRKHPGVDLTLDLHPSLIFGSPKALRSLVSNLIDNGFRHARTSVVIHLRPEGGEVRLVVDDDGKGLEPGDCDRVFARFVRLDEARDRDEGGSGLGLAIVASVAQLHEGRAWATPGPGGHFIVSLPGS